MYIFRSKILLIATITDGFVKYIIASVTARSCKGVKSVVSMYCSARDVKQCHFAAGVDPCVETAFQRPDLAQALVHQQAGDTRRAGFARSTAIDNDVVFGRNLADIVFGRDDVHRDGAGNMPRIDFARRG